MEIIADLHIHSRYSMATSKLGTPEYLDLWARKKGISLVGTGDFTHPAWREAVSYTHLRLHRNQECNLPGGILSLIDLSLQERVLPLSFCKILS